MLMRSTAISHQIEVLYKIAKILDVKVADLLVAKKDLKK
jgi:hypothetical protein